MVLVTVFVSYLLLSVIFNFGDDLHKRPPVEINANSKIEII